MAKKRKMQKKDLDQRPSLERYGMIFCPHCNGRGRIFKTLKEFNVCVVCGGFGAIKAPTGQSNDGWPLMKPER